MGSSAPAALRTAPQETRLCTLDKTRQLVSNVSLTRSKHTDMYNHTAHEFLEHEPHTTFQVNPALHGLSPNTGLVQTLGDLEGFPVFVF